MKEFNCTTPRTGWCLVATFAAVASFSTMAFAGPPASCLPDAGDCCDPGGTGSPGCDDVDCCSLVCGIDSFCCDVVWDSTCADTAADPGEGCAACTDDPAPICEAPIASPPGALTEDACGSLPDSNDGCNDPDGVGPEDFQDISFGDEVFGSINTFVTAGPDGDVNTRDIDWFEVDITEATAITVTCNAEFPCIVAIANDLCGDDFNVFATGDNAFDVDGSGTIEDGEFACEPFTVSADVEAGTVHILVTSGNAGGGLFTGLDCGEAPNNNYVMGVDETAIICGPGSAGGACDAAVEVDSGIVGCEDADCCNFICSLDDFCCQTEWDELCAANAGVLCDDTSCDLPEGGAIAEAEPCGDETNGGCNQLDKLGDPTYESIPANSIVTGTTWADGGTRGLDWFEIDVPDADGSGDEIVTVTISSNGPTTALLLDVPACDAVTVLAAESSINCVTGTFVASVPAPASYVILINTSLADGTQIFDGMPCGYQNDYVLTVDTASQCSLDAPEGSVHVEADACGEDTNSGCNADVPGPADFEDINDGDTVVGTVRAGDDGFGMNVRDTDWYEFDVTDTDGDGFANICISGFQAESAVGGVGMFIVNDGCDDLLEVEEFGHSFNCADTSFSACVDAPGTYRAIVLPANPDGSGVFTGLECEDGNSDYQFTLDIEDDCDGCGDGPPPCPWDLTGDGSVGPADLAQLLGNWGPCPGGCDPDFTGDEVVGPADLAQLLGNWGDCPA